MNKLLAKIRVSILWIPYLLFLSYFKVAQMVWIVFMMLMIHELGHLFMGYYLKIPLISLRIYPFGIFAEYENLDYLPSKYEMYMAISGPLFQLFNFIILNIFYQYQMISLNQLDYYQLLNIQMAIFNLLPIYPLDGGRILRAICMHFFPFGKALNITYILSVIAFICSMCNMTSIWMWCFIIVYAFYLYKEYQMVLEKKLEFYFQRFQSKVVFKNKIHNHNDLYKDFHNIIVHHNKRMTEKEWISRYFVKKSK